MVTYSPRFPQLIGQSRRGDSRRREYFHRLRKCFITTDKVVIEETVELDVTWYGSQQQNEADFLHVRPCSPLVELGHDLSVLINDPD